MEFSTAVSVSENAQKNLGESTHPIVRTRLIQTMHPSYPGNDRAAYSNSLTCNGVTVPRWYASMTSRLDTRTVPWTSYAPQTSYRMRGKATPKCSNYIAASLSVVL